MAPGIDHVSSAGGSSSDATQKTLIAMTPAIAIGRIQIHWGPDLD
jgi:hypothetical protein